MSFSVGFNFMFKRSPLCFAYCFVFFEAIVCEQLLLSSLVKKKSTEGRVQPTKVASQMRHIETSIGDRR